MCIYSVVNFGFPRDFHAYDGQECKVSSTICGTGELLPSGGSTGRGCVSLEHQQPKRSVTGDVELFE